jgi:hypothetical protein
MPITVLLTDDNEVARRSIRLLLDSDPENPHSKRAIHLPRNH